MNDFLSGLIFLIFGLPFVVLALVIVFGFLAMLGWWSLAIIIPAVVFGVLVAAELILEDKS